MSFKRQSRRAPGASALFTRGIRLAIRSVSSTRNRPSPALPDGMTDQRRQTRYLCSALVTLRWQTGRERHKATVLLENISALGACLQAEFPLTDGTRVRMACG